MAEPRVRIVYDEAALEQLLDREQVWRDRHETEAAEKDDEYLAGFKVAKFEVQELADGEAGSDELVRAMAAAKPPPKRRGRGRPPKSEQADAGPDAKHVRSFWEGLLKGQWQEEVVAADEEAKKSRRRTVVYKEFYEGEDGQYYEDDEPAEAMDSGDEEFKAPPQIKRALMAQAEGEGGRPEGTGRRGRPRRGDLYAPGGWPLVLEEGSRLLVLGLNQLERESFARTVMRFGLGTPEEQAADGFWSAFKNRMGSTRPMEDIRAYGRMFIKCLDEGKDDPAEPATRGRGAKADQPKEEPGEFENGVAKAVILGRYRLTEIRTRLHCIQLFKDTLARAQEVLGGLPELPATPEARVPRLQEFPYPGPGGKPQLSSSQEWGCHEDAVSLRSVLHNGWGNWREILEDKTFGLDRVRRALAGWSGGLCFYLRLTLALVTARRSRPRWRSGGRQQPLLRPQQPARRRAVPRPLPICRRRQMEIPRPPPPLPPN